MSETGDALLFVRMNVWQGRRFPAMIGAKLGYDADNAAPRRR
jgi:hypothetical protein